MNATVKKCSGVTKAQIVREYDIGGKGFIVKSVFIGNQDVRSVILKLAERKAISEMGLDHPVI